MVTISSISAKSLAIRLVLAMLLLYGCASTSSSGTGETPTSAPALAPVTPAASDEPATTAPSLTPLPPRPENAPTKSALPSPTPVFPQKGVTPEIPVRPVNTPSMDALSTPASGQGEKIVVSGVVIDGGDTTPKGLLDAPRTFVYEIRQDNGDLIFVSYIAYPPSPAADRPGPELDFYAGAILPGHYLIARGTYDVAMNRVEVIEVGDYINTYPQKP